MIRPILLASLIGFFSLTSTAKDFGKVIRAVQEDLEKETNYQSRDSWSAMEITPERAVSCKLESDPLKNAVVVLSTQSSVNTKGLRCPQIIEGDYVRRNDATFCGIGTNFVVDAEGTIFQGRELGHKAACSVPNTGVIGITLAGCFDSLNCDNQTEFSEAVEDSLVTLIAILSYHYGIEINKRNVLPMSSRTDAVKFRGSPGNLVTGKWASLLEAAQTKQLELYYHGKDAEF